MPVAATCPEASKLEHFSLGQLRETDAQQLEDHLARCSHCVETLKALRNDEDTLVEAMRAQPTLRDRPRVDTAVTRLMKALKAWPGPGSRDGRDRRETVEDVVRLLAAPKQADEMGRLGSYRILGVLGAGGMGVVFAAEDMPLRRKVALKVLPPLLAASAAARKRFLREGQAAAAVASDHIVHIYQVGEERGLPFLAMQYLEGETLEARLARQGPLLAEEVVRIGRELADGLAAAHARGLLHRDIKPANIWLENGGRVKILDFGLAWIADDAGRLTENGTVLGTPSYMAPEQARGEPVDVRSDLFSLGSVLYTMCTGRPPFEGATTFATLEQVRTAPVRPIREINAAIPADLAAIVDKLHSKDRADRHASASAVAEALRQCMNAAGQRVSQARWNTLDKKRWWVAAAVLLLLPLVALAVTEAAGLTFFFQQEPDAIEASPRPAPLALNKPEKIQATESGTNHDQDIPKKTEAKPAPQAKAPKIYAAALFPFEERGPRDLASKVTDLLFAKLAGRAEFFLVDRADLRKTLQELELNLTAMVKPGEENKIGQLTGARLLIGGSVVEVDRKIYLVAKIVGTETSRLAGTSVDGKADDLVDLVDRLAEQIADKIAKEADKLVAKPASATERIAAVNAKLGKSARPTVVIQIAERRIGAAKIDPAAETEFGKFCKETGFTLLDPDEASAGRADIIIKGEGFSETAARHGNLICVKARLEVKATERKTGKLLAVDRQTSVAVDLSEQIASKAALQEAAAILVERILPRLVEKRD